jgi:hypothetical protein
VARRAAIRCASPLEPSKTGTVYFKNRTSRLTVSRDARARARAARATPRYRTHGPRQDTERRCPHVGRLRTRGRPPRSRSGPRLPLPERKAPRACSKAVGEMKARAADALRPAARGTPKELETREADDGRAPRPRRSRPPGSATSRCRSITSGTAPPLANAANQTLPSPRGTLGAQTRRPRARYPTP